MAIPQMTQLYFSRWQDVPPDAWRWPNFSPWEIAVRDRPERGAVLIVPAALDALQRLRGVLGDPVTVLSGYRDPEHNARVGGALRSKHTMGIAFDLSESRNYSREALAAAAREAGFLGLGHYETFLHVDLGSPREWRA